MNKELLLKVKEHILAEPRRLDMTEGLKRSTEAPCGTAGCIAGWASVLSGKTKLGNYPCWLDIRDNAVVALEIEFYKASKLFYVSDWPTDLVKKYYQEQIWNSSDLKVLAEITAERIDRFIQENP